MTESISPDTVRAYLKDLQYRIMSAIVALDGSAITVDAWQKPAGEKLQGSGITQILETVLFLNGRGAVSPMYLARVCRPQPQSSALSSQALPLKRWGYRSFSTPGTLWCQPFT